MSAVQQTSIESYYQFTPEELGNMQNRVLDIIEKKGPINNRQISEDLNISICSVTGRVKELREMHLVRAFDHAVDPMTDRRVNRWVVVQ